MFQPNSSPWVPSLSRIFNNFRSKLLHSQNHEKPTTVQGPIVLAAHVSRTRGAGWIASTQTQGLQNRLEPLPVLLAGGLPSESRFPRQSVDVRVVIDGTALLGIHGNKTSTRTLGAGLAVAERRRRGTQTYQCLSSFSSFSSPMVSGSEFPSNPVSSSEGSKCMPSSADWIAHLIGINIFHRGMFFLWGMLASHSLVSLVSPSNCLAFAAALPATGEAAGHALVISMIAIITFGCMCRKLFEWHDDCWAPHARAKGQLPMDTSHARRRVVI